MFCFFRVTVVVVVVVVLTEVGVDLFNQKKTDTNNDGQ